MAINSPISGLGPSPLLITWYVIPSAVVSALAALDVVVHNIPKANVVAPIVCFKTSARDKRGADVVCWDPMGATDDEEDEEDGRVQAFVVATRETSNGMKLVIAIFMVGNVEEYY